MPTQMLTTTKQRERPAPSAATVRAEEAALRRTERVHAARVRRLKVHAAAWALGIAALTALWVGVEWNGNGAFQRFAHEGNPGDWNPTLWALAVGIWSLVVGIMALRVRFERPVTAAEIDRAAARLAASVPAPPDELRRFARRRLEGVRRLRFHAAAWVLGMVVIAPLNALIEWQDNGRFERLSGNSRPGSWDPWIAYVGGIWALAVAVIALFVYLDRPGRPRWPRLGHGR